ncbi:MAG: PAS domain S-box protein, partial [Chloroflexota bacterium]
KRIVDTFLAKGYQAHTALTVHEAQNLLDQTAYDIAVIDYHLPDGLGDELLQALHEKYPDCVCMMVTADPQPELALTWMQMGAAAYLHKPFEPEYLIALCERARREHALLRSQDLLEQRTRQLLESEQKYRNMVQYSSDPIFAFNPDETYRYVNEAFARPFGKKPEEIIGKTPFDIFPREEAEKRLRLVRRIFATREKEEIDVKVVTYTGEERFYLTLADPIKDEQGQVLYVSCISKDITERKRTE